MEVMKHALFVDLRRDSVIKIYLDAMLASYIKTTLQLTYFHKNYV